MGEQYQVIRIVFNGTKSVITKRFNSYDAAKAYCRECNLSDDNHDAYYILKEAKAPVHTSE